tara:strand:- start:132 stop:338 length:207 start_codon:yes stop_codon:yes gene_type:complete
MQGQHKMETEMTRITETSIGQLTLTTYDDGQFALPQGYFTDIPRRCRPRLAIPSPSAQTSGPSAAARA